MKVHTHELITIDINTQNMLHIFVLIRLKIPSEWYFFVVVCLFERLIECSVSEKIKNQSFSKLKQTKINRLKNNERRARLWVQCTFHNVIDSIRMEFSKFSENYTANELNERQTNAPFPLHKNARTLCTHNKVVWEEREKFSSSGSCHRDVLFFGEGCGIFYSKLLQKM